VEGRQVLSFVDYFVNNVVKLDESQLKKIRIAYIDLAGRTGSKEE
jgi:hypothetical protein